MTGKCTWITVHRNTEAAVNLQELYFNFPCIAVKFYVCAHHNYRSYNIVQVQRVSDLCRPAQKHLYDNTVFTY